MRPSQILTFLENFTSRRPLRPASAQTTSQLESCLRRSSRPSSSAVYVVAPIQELLAAHTESGPWTNDDDGRRRLRQGVEGDYERATRDEYG